MKYSEYSLVSDACERVAVVGRSGFHVELVCPPAGGQGKRLKSALPTKQFNRYLPAGRLVAYEQPLLATGRCLSCAVGLAGSLAGLGLCIGLCDQPMCLPALG